ncbi:MAG: hypothetical protein GX573_02590 [Chloroflexi bacterium]|nr:hypothetical protein [Chloroflexota bacterium]
MADQQSAQQATPLSALIIGLGGSGAWTLVHVKRQLMDMYNNQLPANVALAVFDTATDPIVGVGAEGMRRELGTGVGKVGLEPYEYVHVGGDAYEMVQRVARTDQYPFIESWLLADKYLKELPRALFQLEKGAGMFRQLGRLALFRSVAQPANSPVAAVLDTKLTNLARQSGGSIVVMLVGSLAGGTGAGLFLDVPHIVRRVALANNIKVTLRGFFYLPQAFQRDLDSQSVESAKARAFAAMRELKRFMLSEDYKYGYPMYYHGANSGVNKAIWRAKSQEKLYDFVYIVDGEGEMRMNVRALKDGSASVVADAIVSFVDPSFGEVNEQVLANIPNRIADRQGRVGKQAMVSSLGAYSIILPVQQMIEAWSYRLGKEIVQSIVPGEAYNEQGYMLRVSAAHNPEQRGEKPAVVAEQLMTKHTPLPHPQDERRSIVPTALWEQVHHFYDRSSLSRQNAVRELSAYDLRTWLNMLVPQAVGADPSVTTAIAETRQVIEDTVHNHVQTSDKRKPRGDPSMDWRDIATKSERYITSQLGSVDTGGGRQGGRYGDALNRFVDLQLARFRDYLAAYIMHTLNGSLTSSRDPIQAKSGKLGWTIAVIDELYKIFTTVSDLLEEVRAGIDNYVTNMRSSLQTGLDHGLTEMREKASEHRRLGRHPGIAAQETYLARVEDYVEFQRTEFARGAVALAVRRIYDFLEQVRSELQTWASVLGTDTHGLYNELLVGTRRVQDERAQAENLANHRVINDPEWEQRRYDEYVESEQQRARMFAAWNWSVVVDGEQLVVDCMFGDGEQVEPLRKDMRGRWAEKNLQAMLAYMREVFAHAVERESVLQYLMQQYVDNADELAIELARRSGHLLSMQVRPEAEGRTVMNVLLASHKSDAPNETGFLAQVLRRMGGEKGLGDTQDQDFPTLKQTQCANPFRLTVLSTAELIELRGIDAYDNCKARYDELPWDTRQTAHIFPAEVRAVEYEKELVRLKQTPRMLSDRVVLLLENESRFHDFLFLLAHGIIVKREVGGDGTHTNFAWFLRAPDPSSRRGEIIDWWLTMPSDAPSLLEAMITYIVLEEDIRGTLPTPQLQNPIPYDAVLSYLRQARREDTLRRVDQDNLAIKSMNGDEPVFDIELRRWVEAFMPPIDPDTGEEVLDGWDAAAFLGSEGNGYDDSQRQLGVAELVVRHDMARELRQEFASDLPRLEAEVKRAGNNLIDGQAHDALRERQETYDLYTTAVLALDREIARLQQVIENRYEEKVRGKGRRLGRH